MPRESESTRTTGTQENRTERFMARFLDFCLVENHKNPIPASYSILRFRFLIKIFKFHIRYFYHTKNNKQYVLPKTIYKYVKKKSLRSHPEVE